jgi:hypothetical protein
MKLRSANATFESKKTVTFIRHEGRYGPALYADRSSITFNGPVTVANNVAWSGAGGAFYLALSNVTFNGVTTVRDNTLEGCTMVRDTRGQQMTCMR